MSRILALDYGTKRIGVAISDPLLLTAYALPFLENNASLINKILELIQEKEINKIIIGNPLKLNGQQSQKNQEVTQFKNKLESTLKTKELSDMEIMLWDERFSTVSAEKHLISMNVRREKRKTQIDSLAAVFILQGYLDRVAK